MLMALCLTIIISIINRHRHCFVIRGHNKVGNCCFRLILSDLLVLVLKMKILIISKQKIYIFAHRLENIIVACLAPRKP